MATLLGGLIGVTLGIIISILAVILRAANRRDNPAIDLPAGQSDL